MPSAGQTRQTTTAYQTDALGYLYEKGAHFVRCRPDKRPLERRDIHKDRRIRTAPALPDVLAHVQDGGLLAVIPPSISSAVVDVDKGDYQVISDRWPPFLSVRSGRPGRRHLFYPTTQVWHDSPFDVDGVSGEVKSTGYAILHNDTAERLAEAFDRGADRDAVPFEEVQTVLWELSQLDRVAPRRAATPSSVHGDESKSIPEGQP